MLGRAVLSFPWTGPSDRVGSRMQGSFRFPWSPDSKPAHVQAQSDFKQQPACSLVVGK